MDTSIYKLKAREGELDVLSYPGGPIETPPALQWSVLALSDGKILVSSEIENLQVFRDYKAEAAFYYENNGIVPKIISTDDKTLNSLYDRIYDPNEKEENCDLKDLIDDEPKQKEIDEHIESKKEDNKNIVKDTKENKDTKDKKDNKKISEEEVSNKETAVDNTTIDKQEDFAEKTEDDELVSHDPKHKLRAPRALLEMVALTKGNVLYVADHYINDPAVAYYIKKIKDILQNKVTVEKISFDELSSIIAKKTESISMDSSTSITVRLAAALLREAMQTKSSDIHIRVEAEKTRILFRKTGWLRTHKVLTRDQGMLLGNVIYNTMMSASSVGSPSFNPRMFGDGQIAKKYLPYKVFNVREFHAPTATGGGVDTFTMVLRVQYDSNETDKQENEDWYTQFKTLGYTEDQIAQLIYLSEKKTGISIFSGPMGSGKSTSLQAMLKYILSKYNVDAGRGTHVVTLEDPVEYPVFGASQIPVAGGKFGEAMARIMRFDANYVMVGEVRDHETAGKAVEAALTGHSVWTTLHANDEISIIRRLEDLKVRPELLYDHTVFGGLISQRLVPEMCNSCKIPIVTAELPEKDKPILGRLKIAGIDQNNVFVMNLGSDCNECKGSGLSKRGRVIVAGIVVTDSKFMDILRNGDFNEARKYAYGEKGGKTIMDNAINLIKNGTVDPRNVEERVGLIGTKDNGQLTVADIRRLVGYD